MRSAAEHERRSGMANDSVDALQAELLRAHREAHQLHRELASLRERVAVEREDREDLLAVIAHEIRTPVTVIRGYVRLLLSGDAGTLAEDQQRFLEETGRSCDKLDTFVTRTLDAARTPGEIGAMEVATASLRPLAEDVADALAGPMRERGVALDLAVDAGHEARFDANGIERVLLNLVGNAVRYARKRIRIDSAMVEAQGRTLLEVTVEDDGPGIPIELRDRIFTPYVRQGDARHGGVGLGLALCRRLVQAHGGEIGVAEAAGGGSRFFFTLPGREA